MKAFFRFTSFLHPKRIHSVLPLHNISPWSNIPKRARYFSTNSQEPQFPDTNAPKQKLGFRDLARKYGLTAFGVYLSLTCIVFCGCFASVVALNIDATQIQTWFIKAKSLIGVKHEYIDPSKQKDEGLMQRIFRTMNVKDPAAVQFATHVLVAFMMTKLFSPFKLLATAMITPIVARKLKQMGLDLGTRKLKDVSKEARGRVRKSMERKML